MEYGLIVPHGIKHIALLHEQIATHPDLPDVVGMLCKGLLEQVVSFSEQIAVLEKNCAFAPGRMISPSTDDHSGRRRNLRHSDQELAPSARDIFKGRDFAAWIGLTQSKILPESKDRLGKVSRWGNAIFVVSFSSALQQ